jgi:hypothetical protein
VLAFADGLTEISAAMVEQAWADLQQLPTPWSVPSPAHARSTSGTIEFGRLDDEEPFEPDAESPSVRFPTERIGRRTAEVAEAEFTEVAALDDFDSEFETLAVHSADDLGHEHDEHYVAADATTQIELTVVETAVDPFGEPFADEESVVDHVAALPSARPAKPTPPSPPRPAVRPAAVVTSAAPIASSPTGTVVLSTASGAPATVAPPAIRPSTATWPSADPAALDQPAISTLSALGAPASTKPSADAATRSLANTKKPRKYGQLFSQLRRNSG